ncbi:MULTISPECIES: DnaJ domain-containing protein [unclassified Prochlorococcus]|uniref:DnaJ domain-containing protein n=1 Tax=unclassified Prochlorococcus TaxID=2627481 RepID=UPI0005338243|nr:MULTISPECIES: DnaJ domain-containing protein [unclassified Prochlorococcus]KGG24753.1 DnaJ-class molecular chaperone CbpA [Prochlorococcus sp. MIT 0701]KGG25904.1 DnaJ-class molecular chaperone CbpA [Prochlorococcus sp. MIT 0702]KGG30922.1 DnaJ-class molecular chaperone CbpA [Prochlorococcus sp. MIT 0703]
MTSTAKPDYWSLLGVSPDSDASQLKRAFRREARRWHPDLNGNDSHAEERFKLVNEAYAVLSDPRRRAAWQGSLSTEQAFSDPFAVGFPTFDEYLEVVLGLERTDEQPVDVADPFPSTQVDWPATSPPPPPPPVQATDDLETLVELTPEQALYGTSVDLELDDGTLVEVDTPPLAGDGWRLRLVGVAPGGRDHFLQLRVQTEDRLRIDGLRVLYRLELFPPDAALGCAVDVPTLSGPVTLQVPPASSSGRLLRLRGRGLELDGRRGDQLVEIVVVIPAELAEAERALYRRLQELALDPDNL